MCEGFQLSSEAVLHERVLTTELREDFILVPVKSGDLQNTKRTK